VPALPSGRPKQDDRPFLPDNSSLLRARHEHLDPRQSFGSRPGVGFINVGLKYLHAENQQLTRYSATVKRKGEMIILPATRMETL
jgi:hypothetical protein